MGDRTAKSKKRFDANSEAKPPSPTFFVDRCLGRYDVAKALRAAGAAVEVHDDHFPQDLGDEELLAEVGRQNWIFVTKDRRIKQRTLEREALIKAKVRSFVLNSKGDTGPQMGESLVRALSAMNSMIARTPGPFIGRVTRAGSVNLDFTPDPKIG
jgi:predicted nuclease of predicted toxin-antitoxin system